MKCKNSKLHSLCCKEWFGLGAVAAPFALCPDLLFLLMTLLKTSLGFTMVSAFLLGIFLRKAQVVGWRNDRPFSDGIDSTADLYLFNAGDGNGWNLRGFMPYVESFSLFATPVSWLLKQVKRQCAIVLPDGLISFPMIPVSWLSSAVGAGSRIEVPVGYVIKYRIWRAWQARRDEIKGKIKDGGVGFVKSPVLTKEEECFMTFTDQVFCASSKFVFEAKPQEDGKLAEGLINPLDLLSDRVAYNERCQSERFDIVVRDFVRILGEMKTLLDLGKRLSAFEAFRPVLLGKLNSRVTALEGKKAQASGAGKKRKK